MQGKDQGRMIEKPVTKYDSGTQTDTHILESNIVKSYEWNEWELRRKAIKLVNVVLHVFICLEVSSGLILHTKNYAASLPTLSSVGNSVIHNYFFN